MAYTKEAPLVPGQDDEDAPQNLKPPVSDPVGLATKWRKFVDNDANMSSLIQFGVALSQPIGPGQNWGGQVGQAIGQAGEAGDRVHAQQMAEEEAASKQDLRGAQAEAATARAGAAESRAGAAAQRADFGLQKLELARQIYEMRKQQGDANARIRAQATYAKIAANARTLGEAPPEPFDQWYASMIGAGGGGAPVGGTSAPVRVNRPEDVKTLQSGTRYVTPDGRTGTAP